MDKDIEQRIEETAITMELIRDDLRRLDALLVHIYFSECEQDDPRYIEFFKKEAKNILGSNNLTYYNNDDFEVQIRDDSIVVVKPIIGFKRKGDIVLDSK